MCSFYNPNIQQKFEEDKRNFVELKGVTFGSYMIIYQISENVDMKDISMFKSKDDLSFLRYENVFQASNLMLVDTGYSILLAQIALEVLFGGIHSFEGYVLKELANNKSEDRYEVLYMADKIQDFLELLAYSDVASKHQSTGERCFQKIFCKPLAKGKLVFYTLYERLKLYNFLMREMTLMIDREKSKIVNNELHLCLIMRVE